MFRPQDAAILDRLDRPQLVRGVALAVPLDCLNARRLVGTADFQEEAAAFVAQSKPVSGLDKPPALKVAGLVGRRPLHNLRPRLLRSVGAQTAPAVFVDQEAYDPILRRHDPRLVRSDRAKAARWHGAGRGLVGSKHLEREDADDGTDAGQAQRATTAISRFLRRLIRDSSSGFLSLIVSLLRGSSGAATMTGS